MKIETEYNIGDIVYTISTCTLIEWDKARHKKKGFVYSTDILKNQKDDVIIKETEIEGFIIDEEGIHPAQVDHDGWNKIVTYLSCNKIVYRNLQDAINDLEKGENDG